MKTSLIKKLSFTLALVISSLISANAAPYEKGQKVEAFKATDQFGEAYTFEAAKTHYLLVSHDMETGKKANAALTALGKDYLPAKKSVYMANITGMPGIGRFFAIPKMKSYAHKIVLIDDAALIAKFPQAVGKVTILTLTDGKILSVAYWTAGTESADAYLK